jgi:hypothetical protein
LPTNLVTKPSERCVPSALHCIKRNAFISGTEFIGLVDQRSSGIDGRTGGRQTSESPCNTIHAVLYVEKTSQLKSLTSGWPLSVNTGAQQLTVERSML